MRHFLVVILVGLQFIAPLVHAHVGENPDRFGWHLPEQHQLHAQHQDQQWLSASTELHDQAWTLSLGSALEQSNRIPHHCGLPTQNIVLKPAEPADVILNVAKLGFDLLAIPPPLARQYLSRAPPH